MKTYLVRDKVIRQSQALINILGQTLKGLSQSLKIGKQRLLLFRKLPWDGLDIRAKRLQFQLKLAAPSRRLTAALSYCMHGSDEILIAKQLGEASLYLDLCLAAGRENQVYRSRATGGEGATYPSPLNDRLASSSLLRRGTDLCAILLLWRTKKGTLLDLLGRGRKITLFQSTVQIMQTQQQQSPQSESADSY